MEGGGGVQQELEEVNVPTRTFASREAGAPELQELAREEKVKIHT